MVTLWGHLAMGLLFALPAWILWDGRLSAAFVAFVVATVMVPDLDLVLHDLGLPVKHHGVLHTVVFVVAFAAVAGLLAATVLRPVLVRWWYESEDDPVRRGTIYLFVAGGLALGGLSHLFADMLGADRYEPIEPLWPVVGEPIAIDVAHYTATWLNLGLLVLAVVLHFVLFSLDALPLDHRYRYGDAEA